MENLWARGRLDLCRARVSMFQEMQGQTFSEIFLACQDDGDIIINSPLGPTEVSLVAAAEVFC